MESLRVVGEPLNLAGMVAKRVRVFLAEYSIKQTALAEAIGISKSTVSKWVSGKQTMDLDNIEQISQALGVPPAVFLVGGDPDPAHDDQPTPAPKPPIDPERITSPHRFRHFTPTAA